MALLPAYDAELAAAVAAAGRNDPCPCGSRQKVKRCHGNTTVPASRPMAAVPLGVPRPPAVRPSPRGEAAAD